MGTSASTQRMNFGVLLGMRDPAGATATLQKISDPTSASYGKWLTNAQFDARYAPAKSAVAAVQAWLRSRASRSRRPCRAGCTSRPAVRPPRSRAPSGRAAQLLLPGQGRAREHLPAVPAGQHPGRGHRRDQRRDRGRPGLRPQAHRRHRARAAARCPLRRAAVLGLLRAEDGHRQADGVRQAPAVRGLRVRAPAAPVGLRRERAAQAGIDGHGRHRRDHRRLRLADDLPDAQKYNGAPPAPVQAGPVLPDHPRPERLRPTSTSAVRRAGTARRRSTSRPCTRWRPAPRSSTSARPTASAAWTTRGPRRSTTTSPT